MKVDDTLWLSSTFYENGLLYDLHLILYKFSQHCTGSSEGVGSNCPNTSKKGCASQKCHLSGGIAPPILPHFQKRGCPIKVSPHQWEPPPVLPHFQKRVCPAKVSSLRGHRPSNTSTLPEKGVSDKSAPQGPGPHSPVTIRGPGPHLLEAIGRRGPGSGASDLDLPRFSTGDYNQGSSRPPAPAFSDPRPSRGISTAPPENTFAAGTPL